MKPRTDAGRAVRAIWDKIHSWTPPEDWSDFGHYEQKRSLTESEWTRIQEVANSGSLIATIGSFGMIQGFALLLFEPAEPIYPGADLSTILVLKLPATQLPGNSPDNPHEERYSTRVEMVPGGAWDLFTRLCNTERNLAALKANGIEPPKNVGHYQY